MKNTKKKLKIYKFAVIAELFLLLVIAISPVLFQITLTPRYWGEQRHEPKTIDINDIVPEKGVELSVQWGDLGKQMVESGVIDKDKIEALYAKRGGMNEFQKNVLFGDHKGDMVLTQENANFLLNMFWALGLSNESDVLMKGEMSEYENVARLASTGGWSLAKGEPMDHYGKHNFIKLTEEQQKLVSKTAKNIYRPCCNNSTHFPDCNHGMAMLGFLQLLAVNGAGEEEMYEEALKLNSYWFPDNYSTIAQYFLNQDVDWEDVDPKEVLGVNFSSGSGYRDVLRYVQPQNTGGGGSCAV